MGDLCNIEQASRTLGVNRRTVEDWLNVGAPGEKINGRWKIDLADLVKWRIERERQNTLREVGSIDESEARRRKLAAQVALIEHETAMKTGAAVSIADFEASMAAMIGAARARLLGVGAKIGPALALIEDTVECQDAVDGAIREALQELSEFKSLEDDGNGAPESAGGDAADGAAVGAASKADRKRVVGRRAAAVVRKQR